MKALYKIVEVHKGDGYYHMRNILVGRIGTFEKSIHCKKEGYRDVAGKVKSLTSPSSYFFARVTLRKIRCDSKLYQEYKDKLQ